MPLQRRAVSYLYSPRAAIPPASLLAQRAAPAAALGAILVEQVEHPLLAPKVHRDARPDRLVKVADSAVAKRQAKAGEGRFGPPGGRFRADRRQPRQDCIRNDL